MPKQFDKVKLPPLPPIDFNKITWQDISSSLVDNGMIPDVLMGVYDEIPDPLLQQAVAHIKKSKLAQ
jgi:hypothetical protein